MTKPGKTIYFLMRTLQKAFRDVSVVTSGNKPQTKSAIFKFNYYLIQANNEKIILPWIIITNKLPFELNLFCHCRNEYPISER